MVSRLVLIDRDGTINVEKNYITSPAEIELYEGAADGVKLLRQLGLRVVVVTNQSAIGRGFFGLARLEKIHDRLRRVLDKTGTSVDAIYFCPHLPQDKCKCRKPLSGMALRAAREFGAQLSRSFVIGDNVCDIELGKNVGATTVLVRTGYGAKNEREKNVKPDFVVENLFEAAILIKELLEKDET